MTDEQDCEVCEDGEDCVKVTLKELKDYKYDILTFIKVIENIMIAELLHQIIQGLNALHENNFVHCDLQSDNISMKGIRELYQLDIFIDPVLCELSNDLTLNSDIKNNTVYGSIPYIPIPLEVLRGYEFTEKGDIFSFGGIMYEVATGNQPFVDQAHDTYLMVDICNEVRPKGPCMMLNLISKCYLDSLYQCWDDDPSKRPTTREVINTIIFWKISNVIEKFIDAYDNRERMNKSHKQKLDRFLSKFHPQSFYNSRHIYTFSELQDSLEYIKSGKCAANDANIINLNSRKICCPITLRAITPTSEKATCFTAGLNSHLNIFVL
ncbi:hypothetical protein Glove_552g6 [Diversispora epigaea]|uniref:Protein kinase domain-containing protein n=1 Tax=Diversispora epigaea TaxID=1348612 RepID=A0A397GG26_9GLOM|nr:hypothetical protein Glove_552g6 [Diversispora epigaea]